MNAVILEGEEALKGRGRKTGCELRSIWRKEQRQPEREVLRERRRKRETVPSQTPSEGTAAEAGEVTRWGCDDQRMLHFPT